MSPRLVGSLVAAAGLLGYLASRQDTPGRVLMGAAATGLLVEALRGAALRPTLRADDSGLEVVSGVVRRRYAWEAVDDVRVDTVRRRFVSATSLEIDLGDRLLLVPAYRLGRPLSEVREVIRATSARLG
jgi:hypothetical protein